ncbi:AbrB/MazE/SpoVT family DNA-binding domain-containing protein [Salaquimonas pukyongi]|uniref:AbrB/MazE/SpoVT family DNA-binding domain-containing protein n=1 Tax=Salaquimonas pukyongi TaxID=2712698 RepID=UPI00096B94DE|nr:AbrB/MazE/SpoVT family DNA-binding domain-containing protein [Salaquimonas pukyongi]
MGARAKITDKGQITLPKEIRDRHGLKPGDHVEFVLMNGHYVLFPKNVKIGDLAGILGKPPSGESLTLEQIDDAIGEAVAADDERILREWRERNS